MSQTITLVPVKNPEWSPVLETELWEDDSSSVRAAWVSGVTLSQGIPAK